MSVADQVKEIIAEELSVSPDGLKDSSNFDSDFQMDSLTKVQLIMELEEKFGIDIPEEDLDKLRTVGDVVAYIEGALKQKE